MAAEREPPPLGDGKPADFEEQEDGEDLFTSTVTTLEVRPRHRRCCAPSLTSPSGALSLHELVPPHPTPHPPPGLARDLVGRAPVTGAPPQAPVSAHELVWAVRPSPTRRPAGGLT